MATRALKENLTFAPFIHVILREWTVVLVKNN